MFFPFSCDSWGLFDFLELSAESFPFIDLAFPAESQFLVITFKFDKSVLKLFTFTSQDLVMLSESAVLALELSHTLALLTVSFEQHHQLILKFTQLSSYLHLFSVGRVWSDAKRLLVCLLLLQQLQNQLEVAFLVLGVDVIIETHIVLEGLPHFGQRRLIQ